MLHDLVKQWSSRLHSKILSHISVVTGKHILHEKRKLPGKGIHSVALTLKGFSKLHSLLNNTGPLNGQPLPTWLMLDSHQRKLSQALTLNLVGRHWESSALSCICRLRFVSSQGHHSCEGQGTPGSAAKLLLLNSTYELVMLGSRFFLSSLGPSRPLLNWWCSGSRPSQLWRPLPRFKNYIFTKMFPSFVFKMASKRRHFWRSG